MKISRIKAAQLLLDYDSSRIFSVTFIKRTDGKIRTLVGRKGVTKGVTGEGLKFDPGEKGLVVLFDVQKDQFRMVALESIISIRMDGKEYKVKG